jgi:CMP-N-acetylneuraminic acid synthetase
MKIICMIPARLNSKRVIKKNLRLIDGKPLISYALETISKTSCFDEIYLNSESELFRDIANEYKISFYKRDKKLSTDKIQNDDFAIDFMNRVPGDILIQVLPTSPFITANEIQEFTKQMVDNKLDTQVSVEHKKIACVYKNEPINFNRHKIVPPSQQVEPIKSYATVLMGWKYKNYKENMRKYGAGYHGADGKIGYFELRGLSTIDIDREEDFILVENIILSRKTRINIKKRYYNEK